MLKRKENKKIKGLNEVLVKACCCRSCLIFFFWLNWPLSFLLSPFFISSNGAVFWWALCRTCLFFFYTAFAISWMRQPRGSCFLSFSFHLSLSLWYLVYGVLMLDCSYITYYYAFQERKQTWRIHVSCERTSTRHVAPLREMQPLCQRRYPDSDKRVDAIFRVSVRACGGWLFILLKCELLSFLSLSSLLLGCPFLANNLKALKKNSTGFPTSKGTRNCFRQKEVTAFLVFRPLCLLLCVKRNNSRLCTFKNSSPSVDSSSGAYFLAIYYFTSLIEPFFFRIPICLLYVLSPLISFFRLHLVAQSHIYALLCLEVHPSR